MKRIIIYLQVVILCLFSQIDHISANNDELTTQVELIFTNYVNKYEKNYSKSVSYNKIIDLETKLSKIIHGIDNSTDNYIVYNTLLQSSREYIFEYKYINEKIKKNIELKKYNLSNQFSNKIVDKDEIFLENGIWYTYVFTSYLSFPDGITPTESDLEHNNISTDNDLLYLNNGKFIFIQEYKKVKLISDEIIYGIPNKNQFLLEVKDDKRNIQNETDNDFKQLKIISHNLTKDSKSKDDKIELIYNYILDNVNYTSNVDLSDKKIFSGIQTFKNKDGVCEGYVKYFQYLLQFSGIEDVESLRGYVIDAQDYPQVGHAWTKIGDYYYDPTFDDPIGLDTTKQKEDYTYYKLPKDIFYTNRYDYGTPNSILEKSPIEYREQYIQKQLVSVFPKYINSDYNILKELQFREEYGFDLYNDITLEDFKNIFGYTEVDNFTYQEKGKNIRINKYNYYTISTTDEIKLLFYQLKYDLSDHKLYKWTDENGNIDYRLGFNIDSTEI